VHKALFHKISTQVPSIVPYFASDIEQIAFCAPVTLRDTSQSAGVRTKGLYIKDSANEEEAFYFARKD